jgi:hypothetical protein
LDKEHWLAVYESVRHGFLTTCDATVRGNALFSDLLDRQISFYRRNLPKYALVLHPGGAPDWTRQRWVTRDNEQEDIPIINLIKGDLAKLTRAEDATAEITIEELMEMYSETQPDAPGEERDEAEY